MDAVTKYKYTAVGLAVMVLLNGILLLIIWLGNPDQTAGFEESNRPRGQMHQLMKSELNLNAAQVDSIQIIRRNHHQEVRSLRRKLAQNRRAYFNLNLNDEQSRDSLERLIAQNYIHIEQSMYRYFKRMKANLNVEQQEKFQEMMNNSVFRGSPGMQQRRGRGEGR